MRPSKALLELISVLILPVALLWSILSLSFGSPVGWFPLGYFAVLLGSRQELRAGEAVILEKGSTRSVSAGAHGVRYLSVHLRRPPLQIGRRGQATASP